MTTKDFLLEIGCAELPAKNLFPVVLQLKEKFEQLLEKAHLSYAEIKPFATPRRLALLVKKLSTTQPDRFMEKRGPAINAPDKAKIGFAQACGTTIDNLKEKEGYLYYHFEEKGQPTESLLPTLVHQALSQLVDIKTMRWGAKTFIFIRPVQWILMLFGNSLIKTELYGLKTTSETLGHRFHHPTKIVLVHAKDYEETLLEEGFVRVDFEKRREYIRQALEQSARAISGQVIIDESLLDEVTGLVEWPVILTCQFSSDFLSVPKEALMTSMQQHQKCFPIYDANENLQPYFLTVSNIQSSKPQEVIRGNERVMRARLADAAFFFEQDKTKSLVLQLRGLEKVIFQQKLGSMADKVTRIVKNAEAFADKIHVDKEKTRKAAILCKADLLSDMVNEFPELQGIMGSYYAKLQGEPEEIAIAIREHYLPRFAKDHLPKTAMGCAIALADRFDTLNSIFSIGQIPTGEKDPFGLRRAALGIIRIITEKNLKHISLDDFCKEASLKQFILERLPSYYQENQISLDTLQAILEVEQNNLADIYTRALALENFRKLPEAVTLAEANKRVKNILKKNELSVNAINEHLFEHAAEKALWLKILSFSNGDNNNKEKDNKLDENQHYKIILEKLTTFRESIDEFFTQVMVEVEDNKLKQNRLYLLKTLRELFLKVADISLLQI